MNEYAFHQHFTFMYYINQLYLDTFLITLSVAFTMSVSTFLTLKEQDTGVCLPVLFPGEILITYS